MYRRRTFHDLNGAKTVLRSLDKRLRRCANLDNTKKFHACCSARSLLKFQVGNGLKTLKQQNYDLRFTKDRFFSLSAASNIWIPFWSSKSEPSALSPQVMNSPPAPIEALSPPDVGVVADPIGVVDTGVADVVAGVIVDPPFVEMGLATKWFPNHFVHQFMEFVHLNTDLPWWSTIVVGTIVIRVLTLPLFIHTRKAMIRVNNHQEETKKLMDEYEKWKYVENDLRRMVAEKKLNDFQKRTGTGPIRMVMTNSAMTVLFITCTMSLRQMITVPVPSLLEGGTLWFTDLSVADPYFVLPTFIGAVVGLMVNLHLRSGMAPVSYVGLIRKARFLPLVLAPLVVGRFSSGILLYMLTTSVFSLVSQRILLIPAVKEALRFPVPKPPSKETSKTTSVRKKWSDWMEESHQKTERRMRMKEIQRERKERVKARKKELKQKPPITYEIGVDALPVDQHTPDFEREWRPPRPKQFGTY